MHDLPCAKEDAPTGATMISCTASRFPACAPPLMTLNQGTGICNLVPGRPRISQPLCSSPLSRANSAKCLYSGLLKLAAPALDTASDTASSAFAPAILGVVHALSARSALDLFLSKHGLLSLHIVH